MNAGLVAVVVTVGIVVVVAVALVKRFLPAIVSWQKLKVGDRIRLAGGYDATIPWHDEGHIDGRLLAFISGTDGQLAAIVRLDKPISCEDLTSDVVLLYLRYADAWWSQHEVVHVELWRDVPQLNNINAALGGERQWIESHAVYEVQKR